MNIPIHGSLDACMAQKFLECLGRHPALDGPGGIGMAKSVHAESFNSVLIAEFIEVGIITAVF